jgi:hypothetical protein
LEIGSFALVVKSRRLKDETQLCNICFFTRRNTKRNWLHLTRLLKVVVCFYGEDPRVNDSHQELMQIILLRGAFCFIHHYTNGRGAGYRKFLSPDRDLLNKNNSTYRQDTVPFNRNNPVFTNRQVRRTWR